MSVPLWIFVVSPENSFLSMALPMAPTLVSSAPAVLHRTACKVLESRGGVDDSMIGNLAAWDELVI